jgi:ankyrin repeat protein
VEDVRRTAFFSVALLSAFAALGCRAYGPMPPLHEAVERNEVASVEKWIRDRRSVDVEYDDTRFTIHGGGSKVRGITPLMVAAEAGNLRIVRMLVDAGADIYRESGYADPQMPRNSVFDHAVEGGDVRTVEFLWNRSDKNAMLKHLDRNFAQVFDRACSNGHPQPRQRELAEFFMATFDRAIASEALGRISANDKCLPTIAWILEHGVKPGARPLVEATAAGRVEIVDFYLSRGAKVDEPARAEMFPQHPVTSPLSYAALAGKVGIMAALLERGANPNFRDTYGRTPLMYACEHGRIEPIALLLDKGADPNAQDEYGTSPLMYVSRLACVGDGASCQRIIDNMGLLLDHGARTDHVDADGRDVTYWATRYPQDLSRAAKLELLRAHSKR